MSGSSEKRRGKAVYGTDEPDRGTGFDCQYPLASCRCCIDEYAYAETADPEIKKKLQVPSDPSSGPKDFFPDDAEELKEEISVATLEGRLQQLKQDLDGLRINYMILPDMNAGKGYLQIAYAAADAPKLKAWYELYQKTIASEGTSVKI